MRQAGTITSEADAHRFADFLLTQGIAAHLDHEEDGWAVWIRDENHLDEAKQLLQDFQYDPESDRYRSVGSEAAAIRRESHRKVEQTRKNIVHMQGRWNRGGARRAPLTFLAIAICVGVFIFTGGGDPSGEAMRKLEFVDPAHFFVVEEGTEPNPELNLDNRLDRLVDIRRGEVWRLISPNYVHLGILHLVFNMYWLWRFGAEIEHRKGHLYLLLMLVVIGVVSNVAQAMIESPFGGGMSGVVYGLFGYAWMKSAYDSGSGFQVSTFTVAIFVIWFFICLTPYAGPIANTAHGAGLILGVVWGYAPQLWGSLSGGK